MLTALFGLRAAVLAAFLLAALSLWPAPAAGQVLCGPQNKLTDLLKQRFGETRQAVGVSTDARRIVELFMAPDGSWTIVATDTRGRSCIVLAGEGWAHAPRMQGTPLRAPGNPTQAYLGWVPPHCHIGVLARLWATQAGVRSLSGSTPPRYWMKYSLPLV